METKSVLAATAAILASTLAACGTTPGPNTTVTCTGTNNAGAITATAGSTVGIVIVEQVTLLDPGLPATNIPLNNASGTAYASVGLGTQVCTGPITACAPATTATIKTDSYGVATVSFTTITPAAGATGNAGVSEIFGAAGACEITVSITGK